MWQLKWLHDSSPCFIFLLPYPVYYYSHIKALTALTMLIYWFLIWFCLATIVPRFSTRASLGCGVISPVHQPPAWRTKVPPFVSQLAQNLLARMALSATGLPTEELFRVHQVIHSFYHMQRQHSCFIFGAATVLIYAGRPTMVWKCYVFQRVTVKVLQMNMCQFTRKWMESSSSSRREWICFHGTERMGVGIKIYCARTGGALPLTSAVMYTATN